jgi:hypothetical protein
MLKLGDSSKINLILTSAFYFNLIRQYSCPIVKQTLYLAWSFEFNEQTTTCLEVAHAESG